MSDRIENIKKLCKGLIFFEDNLDLTKVADIEDSICKAIESQRSQIEKSNYMVVYIQNDQYIQKFYSLSPYNDVYQELCRIDERVPTLEEVIIYNTKGDMKQLIKITNKVIMIIHNLSKMREICKSDKSLYEIDQSIDRCFSAISDIIERALKEAL